MRANRHGVGAAILLGVILGCAAPEKKQEAWPEATRTDYEHKDDPCKEKDGAPRECRVDQDCCEGHVCSLDPERSRVTRYCIES